MRKFKNFALSLKRALIQLSKYLASQMRRPRFIVHSRELRLPRGLNYDNIEALIEAIEGPGHK